MGIWHLPEPSPTLYPTRLPPSPDTRGFEFASDGKEDDIFWIYAEIAAQAQGTIHSDIVVVAI
jgi:hypothetical protein